MIGTCFKKSIVIAILMKVSEQLLNWQLDKLDFLSHEKLLYVKALAKTLRMTILGC